jgi:hypothetical protein
MLLLLLLLLFLQAEFSASVDQGFQASPTWHQGSIIAAEATAAGPRMSTGMDGLSHLLLHVLWPTPVLRFQAPRADAPCSDTISFYCIRLPTNPT